jgi:hypothetical protein
MRSREKARFAHFYFIGNQHLMLRLTPMAEPAMRINPKYQPRSKTLT